MDLNGFPIEYRFTDKIELDEAQRIFYGKSLKSYLIKEVIGPKIIEILEKQPDYILVDEKELLGINEISEVPTIYISNNEAELQGEDEHIDAFNNIPSIKIQLDIEEPFKRLYEAIEFSQNK